MKIILFEFVAAEGSNLGDDVVAIGS